FRTFLLARWSRVTGIRYNTGGQPAASRPNQPGGFFAPGSCRRRLDAAGGPGGVEHVSVALERVVIRPPTVLSNTGARRTDPLWGARPDGSVVLGTLVGVGDSLSDRRRSYRAFPVALEGLSCECFSPARPCCRRLG